MTPKEAFKEYKQVAQWLVDGEFDNYSPYIKLGKDLLEIAPIIEQALNEHEALKRDVARYFELTKKMPAQSFEDYNEWNDLHDKLTKEIVITKCPKCGSKKITVEKRLFGNAECLDCKYYGKYAEFQEKLSKVGKEE